MSDQYAPPNQRHDGRRELLKALAYRCCKMSPEMERIVKSAVLVNLDDGGMGSFFLEYANRGRSEDVAVTAEYVDDDGILTNISLYVDEDGLPTEVEIWKINFESLISYPSHNRLVNIQCGEIGTR